MGKKAELTMYNYVYDIMKKWWNILRNWHNSQSTYFMPTKSTSTLSLKYGTPEHVIEAEALVNSLEINLDLLEDIARQIYPDQEFKFQISTPRRGSLIVDIILQAQQISPFLLTAFSSDNVSYAANLITVFGGVYSLFKFLGGKKATQIEQFKEGYNITNSQGATIYVDRSTHIVYQDIPRVREKLGKNFNVLRNDNTIDYFSASQNFTQDLFKVEKSDFERLSDPETEVGNNEYVTSESARLSLLRLGFDRRMKSDFKWKDNSISAKIEDESFWDKIENGASFSKGDTLEVKLEMVRTHDAKTDAYSNRNFIIKEVRYHHRRGEQLQF